jgi:Domain of unknown function (DUF4926)
MKFSLYEIVVLGIDLDLPQYKLCRGDTATVVEYYPHPDTDGYSLEVFNVSGETIAVITLSESEIESAMPNEYSQANQVGI